MLDGWLRMDEYSVGSLVGKWEKVWEENGSKDINQSQNEKMLKKKEISRKGKTRK